MVAIDRHFPGLHARGGVCPRHVELVWKGRDKAQGLLVQVKEECPRVEQKPQCDFAGQSIMERMRGGMRFHSMRQEARESNEKEAMEYLQVSSFYACP